MPGRTRVRPCVAASPWTGSPCAYDASRALARGRGRQPPGRALLPGAPAHRRPPAGPWTTSRHSCAATAAVPGPGGPSARSTSTSMRRTAPCRRSGSSPPGGSPATACTASLPTSAPSSSRRAARAGTAARRRPLPAPRLRGVLARGPRTPGGGGPAAGCGAGLLDPGRVLRARRDLRLCCAAWPAGRRDRGPAGTRAGGVGRLAACHRRHRRGDGGGGGPSSNVAACSRQVPEGCPYHAWASPHASPTGSGRSAACRGYGQRVAPPMVPCGV